MREQHTLSIVDDQKRLQTEPNRPPGAPGPQGSNKTACQGQCLHQMRTYCTPASVGRCTMVHKSTVWLSIVKESLGTRGSPPGLRLLVVVRQRDYPV